MAEEARKYPASTESLTIELEAESIARRPDTTVATEIRRSPGLMVCVGHIFQTSQPIHLLGHKLIHRHPHVQT